MGAIFYLQEFLMATQLETARAGKISDAVRCVSQQEGIEAEVIRDELAAGGVGANGDTGYPSGG